MYGYDSANHRIYKGALNGTTYSAEEIYFYAVDGHKYGTWQINPTSGVLLQASVTKQWFGRRLVTPEDHLQSRGKYYAFGEERTGITPANPPNDQEKFATYTRDSATGLDYADQRYFNSTLARFMRPDPFGGSANPMVPQTWNRYSYVANDPSNDFDPSGLQDSSFEYGNPDPSYCDEYSEADCSPSYVPPPAVMAPFAPVYTTSLDVGYTPVQNLGSPLNSYDHLFIWVPPDGRRQPFGRSFRWWSNWNLQSCA